MNIKADLGQAGKVEISNVEAKDISFVEFNAVEELFYGLMYKEQQTLVIDFLNGVSENEFKQIISQTNHEV